MLSGLKPGGKKGQRRTAKRSNAEYARQFGEEMINHLAEIARSGEPDAARIVAANSVLERGFGKVLGADPEATRPAIVNVITGVHGESATPAARPLLPDGRNPLEEPAPVKLEEPSPPPSEPGLMDKFTSWPAPANDDDGPGA